MNTPALVIVGTKDPEWPDPEAEARFIADSVSSELVLIETQVITRRLKYLIKSPR